MRAMTIGKSEADMMLAARSFIGVKCTAAEIRKADRRTC